MKKGGEVKQQQQQYQIFLDTPHRAYLPLFWTEYLKWIWKKQELLHCSLIVSDGW